MILEFVANTYIPRGQVFGFYTSRGYACEFYSEVFLVESKALKQAHSKLRNYFSNMAISKNQPIEIQKLDRAEYMLNHPATTLKNK